MLCKKGRRRRAIGIKTIICLDWAEAYGIHLPIRKYFSTMNGRQISDYYQVLGIGRHASQGEIKNAFLMLSKKYHPDVLGPDADGSSQKFLQIREAYETLRDEQKRRLYDEELLGQWTTASSSRKTSSEQYNSKDDWEENLRRAQAREYYQQWRQQQQKWRPSAGERPPFSGAAFRSSYTRRSNEIPKWADPYNIWRAMMQEQFQQRKKPEANRRNTANRNNTKEEMNANREAERQNWWAEYQQREQNQMINDDVKQFVRRHQFVLHCILITLLIYVMAKNE